MIKRQYKAALLIVLVASVGLAIKVAARPDASDGEKVGGDTDITTHLSVEKYNRNRQDGTSQVGDAFNTYTVPRYVTDEILKVTSREASITIKQITLNRGNCELGFTKFPQTLQFGESDAFVLPCDPIEVSIETNEGTATYTWDK